MPNKSKGTIMCSACKELECRHGYPDGIPAYCAVNEYSDVIERTKMEYATIENIDIYRASAEVAAKGYRQWPRIQEAIEFAKELKLGKIGLASCIALVPELRLVTKLFMGAGFNVVSVACQIGRVSPKDRGVLNINESHGATCNPIAQAEILNCEGTELNYILGLCLGHDILFNRYSKAPVSTLIVKDRVTGNNPAAVLYTFHQRQYLTKNYCGEDTELP